MTSKPMSRVIQFITSCTKWATICVAFSSEASIWRFQSPASDRSLQSSVPFFLASCSFVIMALEYIMLTNKRLLSLHYHGFKMLYNKNTRFKNIFCTKLSTILWPFRMHWSEDSSHRHLTAAWNLQFGSSWHRVGPGIFKHTALFTYTILVSKCFMIHERTYTRLKIAFFYQLVNYTWPFHQKHRSEDSSHQYLTGHCNLQFDFSRHRAVCVIYSIMV